MKLSDRQTRWIGVSGAALILLAALVVGAKLDLHAAEVLYNPDNVFSVIFMIIGKVPSYLIMGAAFMVLFHCAASKTSVVHRRVLSVLYLLGALGACSLMFIDGLELVVEGWKRYFCALVGGLLVFIIMFFIFAKFRDNDFGKFKKWAIAAIVAVVCVIVATLAIKLIWGRARYIDVAAGGVEYSPWYKLVRTGGSSMPSGHTALSAGIFLLLPLCKICPSLKGRGFWICCAGTVFSVVTALARMSGGYHFISDVAAAGLIVLVVYLVVDLIAYGKDFEYMSFKEKNKLDAWL